ncbi:MAG: hypothetical protein O2862_01765 [Bacteroidetes bacterium]|nr:hypothetical protein [Bacteroidota bacterium]MDA0851614.1 hypothetical protein [Pseudomonadota bacterium]
MKIYIGPLEIAGFYSNLSNGLNKNNLKCDFIPISPHPFRYGIDSKLPIIISIAHKLHNKRTSLNFRSYFNIITIISRMIALLWTTFAIFKYDIFIFGYGRSFWPLNIDLILIKLLRKKVIMILSHGSEARPPYIDGSVRKGYSRKPKDIRLLKRLTKRMYRKVRFVEKYSTHIIGSPFSSFYFLTKPYINAFDLGLAVLPISKNLEQHSDVDGFPVQNKLGVRILHAPSNTNAKGTKEIVGIIDRLKLEGYEIDFRIVTNQPHNTVLNEISKCDFVVDQMYADTPIAGFSGEAASLGKVSIVGGYIFEIISEYIEPENRPPVINCHPDEMYDSIKLLIENAQLRNDLGKKCKAYVASRGSNIAVAERYLKVIFDDIPKEWYLDPYEQSYVQGGFQDAEKTKADLSLLVKQYGLDALQINDKPNLKMKFKEFCKNR